jgi:hypothetical protein
MAKRNPVVRDLIQRPLRGAGKHRDRRSEVQKRDADRETKNIFTKGVVKPLFFRLLSVYGH